MGALIWDSSTQAFKDAETPLVNGAGGVWTDSVGKVWDSGSQAWVEVWNPIPEPISPSSYHSNVSSASVTLPFRANDDSGNVFLVTSSVDASKYTRFKVYCSRGTAFPSGIFQFFSVFRSSDAVKIAGNDLEAYRGVFHETIELTVSYSGLVYFKIGGDGSGFYNFYINKIECWRS